MAGRWFYCDFKVWQTVGGIVATTLRSLHQRTRSVAKYEVSFCVLLRQIAFGKLLWQDNACGKWPQVYLA